MLLSRPSRRTAGSVLRGRGALSRVVAGVWMLLQLLVVAGLPVADGLIDHSDTVVVHIEDADDSNCPASHGGEICELCHLVHGLRAIASPASIPALVSSRESVDPTTARRADALAQPFLEGRSSRAPPLG